MSEHEEELTPTLAEAKRRRADLHHALVEVEDAISGPAPGREQEWAQEVAGALAALRETLEEHIEVTERPEGLYDEVLHKAPRLAEAVQRLRDEHPLLRDATSEMMAKLRATPVGAMWPAQDARDDLQRLLGRVVRHRQLGADLVWEAYNLDIGGVD